MKDHLIFLWPQFGPQEVCSSFNDVNGKIPHRTPRPLVTSSNKRPHSSQPSNIRITPDAPGLACVWPSVRTPCRSALSFWLSHCTKLVSCIRPVMGDSLKSLPGSCQTNKARLWSDKDKQKVDLWHAVTFFTVERLVRLDACCDVGSVVAMVTLLQRCIAEYSIERCVWSIMSDDARDHLKTTPVLWSEDGWVEGVTVSWHFFLPVRFSYLGLLRMRASILHAFSYAEQQYLMYLNYCNGRFRCGC